jgi:hypothetical protein
MSSQPVFRLFVSSTFVDFAHERQALQQIVFPRLQAHCEQRGARFQPIDLRWGISEEAALDQQTMRLCLAEIRRCQEETPCPNFLVFLGSRYGWRPLSEAIPAEEFEALSANMSRAERQATSLYLRDDNAVPPRYSLPGRLGARPPAIRGAGSSKTRQPIAKFAKVRCEAPDVDGVALAYVREFERPPQPGDEGAGQFIDLAEGKVDKAAAERLQAMRESLRARLEVTGRLHTYGIADHHCLRAERLDAMTTARIEALCASIERDLRAVIDEKLERPPAARRAQILRSGGARAVRLRAQRGNGRPARFTLAHCEVSAGRATRAARRSRCFRKRQDYTAGEGKLRGYGRGGDQNPVTRRGEIRRCYPALRFARRFRRRFHPGAVRS